MHTVSKLCNYGRKLQITGPAICCAIREGVAVEGYLYLSQAIVYGRKLYRLRGREKNIDRNIRTIVELYADSRRMRLWCTASCLRP